jgi:16S rRNA (uracil1498-N3)-methyltransferase
VTEPVLDPGAGPLPGADGPDGRHGPHAFVADVDVPVLDLDDRHHLQRVVRLRAGDPLTVSDGAGRWRPCRFGDDLESTGPVVRQHLAAPAITIAFAPVKGDRPELVVQKLTELGVDRIILFWASRSVVRWDTDRTVRQIGRLRRVAREAAMQCRRCWLPVVEDPTTFDEVARLPGAVLAERDGWSPVGSADAAPVVVLVGPEGGWTPEERATVPVHVGFGAQVLRAETAAITVAAVLGALRSGLVRPI